MNRSEWVYKRDERKKVITALLVAVRKQDEIYEVPFRFRRRALEYYKKDPRNVVADLRKDGFFRDLDMDIKAYKLLRRLEDNIE